MHMNFAVKAFLRKNFKILMFFNYVNAFLCAENTMKNVCECCFKGQNIHLLTDLDFLGVMNGCIYSEFKKTVFFPGVSTLVMLNFDIDRIGSGRIVIFPMYLKNSSFWVFKKMTEIEDSIAGSSEEVYMGPSVYKSSIQCTVFNENERCWLKILRVVIGKHLKTYQSFLQRLSLASEEKLKPLGEIFKDITGFCKKIKISDIDVTFVFLDIITKNFFLFENTISNNEIRNLGSFFVCRGCLKFEDEIDYVTFTNLLLRKVRNLFDILGFYGLFITISHKDDLCSYDFNYDRITLQRFFVEMEKGWFSFDKKKNFITLIFGKNK